MEPECSLPHSQVPASRPYPQPARSSPHPPHIPLPEDPSYRILCPFFLAQVAPKVSVQPRDKCSCFVTKPVFTIRSCRHLAEPSSWRTTSCRLPRLLIQYIRSYRPYWRPFLLPQSEDAPCPGDRDPLSPSAWSDGHCPHAARSHSFVYISTS